MSKKDSDYLFTGVYVNIFCSVCKINFFSMFSILRIPLIFHFILQLIIKSSYESLFTILLGKGVGVGGHLNLDGGNLIFTSRLPDGQPDFCWSCGYMMCLPCDLFCGYMICPPCDLFCGYIICRLCYLYRGYTTCPPCDLCCGYKICPLCDLFCGYMICPPCDIFRGYMICPPCDLFCGYIIYCRLTYSVVIWYARCVTYTVGKSYLRRVTFAVGTWYARRVTYTVALWCACCVT